MTNAKTRESRLFSSTRQHVVKSAAAIVRSFIMYKPYVIFGWSAVVFAVLGLAPFVRYAVLVALDDGGGHLQSLIAGAVLLILAFLSVMLGIISDLIRTNRISAGDHAGTHPKGALRSIDRPACDRTPAQRASGPANRAGTPGGRRGARLARRASDPLTGSAVQPNVERSSASRSAETARFAA